MGDTNRHFKESLEEASAVLDQIQLEWELKGDRSLMAPTVESIDCEDSLNKLLELAFRWSIAWVSDAEEEGIEEAVRFDMEFLAASELSDAVQWFVRESEHS